MAAAPSARARRARAHPPPPHAGNERSRVPALQAEKRQLVPVAALEDDLAADDMKEAAAAQSLRIAPFEDRPLAILEHVLDDAMHLEGREPLREHRLNRFASFDETLRDLMV